MKKIFLFIFIFFLSSKVSSANLGYNNILSDHEATNYNSMNIAEIQEFLESKNSYLSNYWYTGNNPGPIHFVEAEANPDKKFFKKRYASEIIYNASQENKINPQLLLTMLQKEMGLIEDNDVTTRQLGFAMGYYCYDGAKCNPRFKGFGKQVRSTAAQFRYYLDNINQYNHRPNNRSCIGDPTPYLPCTSNGTEIIPENKITASLYVYTPHIHGNVLFKTLWNRYDFTDNVSEYLGIIPDGSLVQAKNGEDKDTIFLIKDGKKLVFENTTSLVSRFDPGQVLKVDYEEIAKFVSGNNIKYANYSILQGPDSKKYLLDNLVKRLIVSDEVFHSLGFNPLEIEEISYAELSLIPDGKDITSDEISVFEQLIRDPKTNGVYYIKDNKKYPVISQEIIDINWPKMIIKDIYSEELNKYIKSKPAKLKDGTLVKSENNNSVYVISNGRRRSLSNEETFINLGYNWSEVKIISDRVFKLHKLGKEIKYIQ